MPSHSGIRGRPDPVSHLSRALLLSLLVPALAAAGPPKQTEPEDPKPPVMEMEGIEVPVKGADDPADRVIEAGTPAIGKGRPPPSPAPAAAAPAAPAEAPRRQRYFSAALKVDCLVPPRDVSATVAVTVELRYLLPFHDNRLSLGVEAGWYALRGSGKGSDADLGSYEYSYFIHNVPIFIGPAYELPIPGLDRTPFDLFVGGGFAMVISRSSGTAFGGSADASGIGLGYYAGAGAELHAWIGRVLVEARYTSAWTDYDLPQEGGKGDLGGVNIYAGYRFIF
jgi:hypothetical protein